MSKLKSCVSAVAVMGLCLGIVQAQASYIIPIESNYENNAPNIRLLIESEITRWKQEALKYKEMIYTDTVGEQKGNKLRPVPPAKSGDINEIIAETKVSAKEGATIIGNSLSEISGVSDIGNYSSSKSTFENKYTVQYERASDYTQNELDTIDENQRVVLNDWGSNGAAMGAAIVANAADVAAKSEPKKRAKEIAQAKELGAMFELMLGMDRRIYERSLMVSATEAATAGVKAMQIIRGASKTTIGK